MTTRMRVTRREMLKHAAAGGDAARAQAPELVVGLSLDPGHLDPGSWFVSEYLKAQGLTEKDVTIKNMDPHIMPSAIDRGDIDSFFIWEPYGA
jgi:hypothetical protein